MKRRGDASVTAAEGCGCGCGCSVTVGIEKSGEAGEFSLSVVIQASDGSGEYTSRLVEGLPSLYSPLAPPKGLLLPKVS